MTSQETRYRTLCPAPRCGKPVSVENDTLYDGRERPWHQACALRALADHFRTPIDLGALAGERVSFVVPTEPSQASVRDDRTICVFHAPHDFDLAAIRILDDRPLYGLYVGVKNAFAMTPIEVNAIRGGDFTDGPIPIGLRVRTGYDITSCFVGRQEGALLELQGVWPPRGTKTLFPTFAAFACSGVDTSRAIPPGGSVEVRTTPVTSTLFTRIAVDDWSDWTIEHVKIIVFKGTAVEEEKQTECVDRPLAGRVTALPTFIVRAGEWLGVTIRNGASVPRRFAGRIYGTGNNR